MPTRSADFALLEAIADWCDRYTPLVGLDPPDGLTLDISGCAHLFGGEAALARDLMRRLERAGLAGARRGRRNGRVCVGRGAVLAIVTASRLGRAGRAKTRSLPSPSRRCASLPTRSRRSRRSASSASPMCSTARARRSRHASARMFVRRLDQALGIEDEPITPRLPLPAALAEQRFRRADRASSATCSARSSGSPARLGARARAARRRRAAVAGRAVPRRRKGVPHRGRHGRAAARSRRASRRLFADRLDVIGDECDPGFGFDMVRLCALVTERRDPQQTGLAQPDHAADLAHLIDRLGARFGLRRVTRLVRAGHAYPGIRRDGGGAASSSRSFPRKRESSVPRTGSPLSRGRAELIEHDAPPPPARSACSRGRSRSRRSPKCRTDRRRSSPGGACAIRGCTSKARSASRWNGGATRPGTR